MDNVLKNCLAASSKCCQKEEIVADATINGASYEHRGFFGNGTASLVRLSSGSGNQ